MEQLSAVGDGSRGPGRDRVSVYCAETRRKRNAPDVRGSPPSRTERGKGGATIFEILTVKDGQPPRAINEGELPTRLRDEEEWKL